MSTRQAQPQNRGMPPRHGEIWVLREPAGSASRSLGDARRLYEEALACLRTRREAEAFELLQEVLWHDPEHAEALSFFGLCLAKQHGEHQQAIDVCAQALELAPGNADVRTNLGRVHRLIGDNAAAHRSFVTAYRRDPGNPAPAAELARMGVRHPPVLRFLSRSHWCNRMLGRARHRLRHLVGTLGRP